MSIANVYLAQNFALIGSDTAGRPLDDTNRPSGDPDITMCKLMPIPLSNAILACRGERSFYCLLWVQLMFNDRGNFDAMADGLADAIERTVSEARKLTANPYTGGTWNLVGWSERLGRMRCVSAAGAEGMVEIDDSANSGHRIFVSPGVFGDQPPVMNTPEAMMECARIQAKHVQDDDCLAGEFAIGGDLLLGVLQRNSLMIENMGPI